MILHQIEAVSVGPFVGPPVMAGPFAPGLNILAAPNETGKTPPSCGPPVAPSSTATPARTPRSRRSGPPAVHSRRASSSISRPPPVCFRIDKTFLQSPRSALFERIGGEWKPVAEADAADGRVQTLLQSTQPGRGATRAAHWGLLGYLWTRQGEAAAWPDWEENPTGQSVRGMLAKVEIDPLIDALRGRMWTTYLENFTPTGQSRSGGSLRTAEEELITVEKALAALDETRQQFLADEEAHTRLADELPRLEAEDADCRRREADALQAAARAAEVQAVEVQGRQHAFEIAQDRLRVIRQDAETLERHARDIDDARRRLAAAEADADRLRLEASVSETGLREIDRALEENAAALVRLQADAQRAGRLARHRQLGETIQAHTLLLERCVAQTDEIDALTRQRAEVPTIPPPSLRRIETLTDSIRDHRAKIEALGLTVELTPSADAPPRSRSARTIIPTKRCPPCPQAKPVSSGPRMGWSLLFRVGENCACAPARWETRALHETLTREETTLQQALSEIGARTLEEARHLTTRAKRTGRPARRRPPDARRRARPGRIRGNTSRQAAYIQFPVAGRGGRANPHPRRPHDFSDKPGS